MQRHKLRTRIVIDSFIRCWGAMPAKASPPVAESIEPAAGFGGVSVNTYSHVSELDGVLVTRSAKQIGNTRRDICGVVKFIFPGNVTGMHSLMTAASGIQAQTFESPDARVCKHRESARRCQQLPYASAHNFSTNRSCHAGRGSLRGGLGR